MNDFHDILVHVHGVIWEGGTTPRPELDDMLRDLADAHLPQGVTRLPTAAIQSGPHLAAQDEEGHESANVVWLEPGRQPRARSRVYALR